MVITLESLNTDSHFLNRLIDRADQEDLQSQKVSVQKIKYGRCLRNTRRSGSKHLRRVKHIQNLSLS